MMFMPADCTIAINSLSHAIAHGPSDSSIAGIPAAVFGNVVSGLVGSVITLVGVLFSNWHNRRLKRDELGHDAKQRNHERRRAAA